MKIKDNHDVGYCVGITEIKKLVEDCLNVYDGDCMSEKRFGWDCPYKDNRDFCTALLKPQICCPSICCFGLSDYIDEQQTTRICAWFEDLLNEAYEDDGDDNE